MALSPATAHTVSRVWQFLDAPAKSTEAVVFLAKKHWKEDHDATHVVDQLLREANLDGTPSNKQIQHLVWVHSNLSYMQAKSDRVMRMVADEVTRALRRGWGPDQWSALLLLKDEGILDELQAVFQTDDENVAKDLHILATDKPRHVTTTKSTHHLSWEKEQYPLQVDLRAGHTHKHTLSLTTQNKNQPQPHRQPLQVLPVRRERRVPGRRLHAQAARLLLPELQNTRPNLSLRVETPARRRQRTRTPRLRQMRQVRLLLQAGDRR